MSLLPANAKVLSVVLHCHESLVVTTGAELRVHVYLTLAKAADLKIIGGSCHFFLLSLVVVQEVLDVGIFVNGNDPDGQLPCAVARIAPALSALTKVLIAGLAVVVHFVLLVLVLSHEINIQEGYDICKSNVENVRIYFITV